MVAKEKPYKHKYETIIEEFLFQKWQEVRINYKKKPFKYSEKPFIFRGLIKCFDCGCTISSDLKKNRYFYLSCSKYRGNCESTRVRGEVVLEQVKPILKSLKIPKEVLEVIKEHLKESN